MGLINEGWKPRIKTKKNRRYITVRKGNNERSLGPYTDELWEKVKPLGVSAISLQVLELKRKISELEGALVNRGKTKRRKRVFKPKPGREPRSTRVPLIVTLMRSQGNKKKTAVLPQAIETQDAFNPYLLDYGLKTPKELIAFFEDKIRKQDETIKNIQADTDRG